MCNFCSAAPAAFADGAAAFGGVRPGPSDYKSLLSGTRQNEGDPLGTAVFVTYSFAEQGDFPGLREGYRPVKSYGRMTGDDRDSVRAALAEFEKHSGVTFIEVPDDGKLSFMTARGGQGYSWAAYPFAGTQDVVINQEAVRIGLEKGSDGFRLVMHEIGHAMGLKHPFEGRPTLAHRFDNFDYTVMSYTWGSHVARELKRLDIDALRHYYGRPEHYDFDISFSTDAKVAILNDTNASHQVELSGFALDARGNGGNDRLTGNDTDDTLSGGDGVDTLEGNGGDDVIHGGNRRDRMVGGTGDDSLYGGDGADGIDGSEGNDSLIGGEDRDTISGGDGKDTLDGGDGRDDLYGGTGNDHLMGGKHTDSMLGGSGDDQLEGGLDRDSLDGGRGDDTLWGGEGRDFLYGGHGRDVLYGEDGNDDLGGESDNDTLRGGEGDDDLRGGPGRDFLSGGIGDDLIYGDDGSDRIYGNIGDDTVAAGSRGDLVIGARGADSLAGEHGADTIDGGDGKDTIDGGSHGDDLAAGRSHDLVFGGTGDDLLSGGEGRDTLHGDDGKDTLIGGLGDDALFSDGGRFGDTLDGGRGNDTLTCNETPGARDTIVYATDYGQAAVFGFNANDRLDIDVDALRAADLADMAQQLDTDVVFAFGGGNRLTLHDVALSLIDDTIFV